MLRIDGVCKSYPGGIHALRNVTLSLPPGAYGLLGPNGAGKTTLMNLLGTLQRPDAGSMKLDGVEIERCPAAVRERLGFLPQDFGFDSRLRVIELMQLFATLKMRRSQGSTDQVRRRLEDVGLWSVRDRRIGTLSGGMKQRLGLAQALLGAPRLVLLDEPTAGLDPEQRERILNVLADFSADAVLIVSTHIADDVRRLCARVGILDDGVLRFTGEVDDLLSRLRGRLWESRKDACSRGEGHPVLRTYLDGGARHVRVVAPVSPGVSFRPVDPALEDGYYYVLGRTEPPW